MTVDLVDCRCRFLEKVNKHLRIQIKSLQILKVSKKSFVHLHKFSVKVHHTSGSGLQCSTIWIHHFSRWLPVSIVAHSTQGDQPLAPHWPPKCHSAIGGYVLLTPASELAVCGGASQGVGLANAAVRQWPVLGLRCRARRTSTWAALGDWTETNNVLQTFYLQFLFLKKQFTSFTEEFQSGFQPLVFFRSLRRSLKENKNNNIFFD